MKDALDRLLDRSLGTARTVVPRLPGRFEPTAPDVEHAPAPDPGDRAANGVPAAPTGRRQAAPLLPTVEQSSAPPDRKPARDAGEPRSTARADADAGRVEGTPAPAAAASTAAHPPAAAPPVSVPPRTRPAGEPAVPPVRPAAAAPPPPGPAAAPPVTRGDRRAPETPDAPAARPARRAAAPAASPAPPPPGPPPPPSAPPPAPRSPGATPPPARRERPAPRPPVEPAAHPTEPAAAPTAPRPGTPPPAAPPAPPRRGQRAPHPATVPNLPGTAPAAEALPDTEQRIEVRIGRIEVRMPRPAPTRQHPHRPVPRTPTVSLDEYLDRRRKG